jgi:microcystin-dependent protein
MSVPVGTIVSYGGAMSTNNIASLLQQGWVVCNGESYSQQQYALLFAAIGTAFGGGNGNFNVPDLRGRFLRGVDMGAGNDPDAQSRAASAIGGNTGDAVGSLQQDEFAAHTHSYTMFPGLSGGIASGSYWAQTESSTGVAGGSETRPKNVYANFIIKALNIN